MSSTNKTTNYELSQYVGSDKPTYLGDYNSDMYKIDTQMKANADNISANTSAISTASTTASTALTNAGTAQNTANDANTLAGTANTTANSALSKANANESSITAINGKFAYSTTEQVIGTWTNGKPLYRKVVFTGTINIGQGVTQISHGISNLEKCVSIIVGFEEQSYFLPYLWAGSTASSTKITCVNYVNASGVGIESTNAWGDDKLYFIIEYTKTTDVAPTE